MKILLSIKPEFVEQIFKGKKKFEYRKSIFANHEVSSVVIYSTMPVGRIVGEFSISQVLMDTPEQIWRDTKQKSGITKTFYDLYFENRNKAYALEIGELTEYKTPINPYELIDGFVPPQSFRYLNENSILINN
ncbi:ASCH domain-containing protein [Myroides sp. 1354]|uniref:ASCH domain-containing protein n=1 Tax=unclassified Myroides TaxID=2642485 RepID=UPI002578923B|nr:MULTISPECIES: ASCH domain-containing protein [unclassified Myroides]MDM1043948.1 ASCH domain-containing protein [Myroides sp. R163-1]MDM1054883.1 ASCH domain-containing protein [Myroides sp. 1354]MDM1068180.1 ASCH domain-containing protein [Myroides sp. 1372]